MELDSLAPPHSDKKSPTKGDEIGLAKMNSNSIPTTRNGKEVRLRKQPKKCCEANSLEGGMERQSEIKPGPNTYQHGCGDR